MRSGAFMGVGHAEMVYHGAINLLPFYLNNKLGDLMSDAKKVLTEKLAEMDKGLFFMGRDRVRALSYHETEDLIDELRESVAIMQAQVNTL